MLRRLAVHAAGLYRAAYREGAYYIHVASKGEDIEAISYKEELQHVRYPRNIGPLTRVSLGNPVMMKYLTKLTLECKHLHAMRILLEYWFALACSDAHGSVLFEFVGGAGELLKFVLKFIEEEDLTVATLSMCIFLQVRTEVISSRCYLSSHTPYYSYYHICYCDNHTLTTAVSNRLHSYIHSPPSTLQLNTIEDGRETIMHTWMTETLCQYTPASSNFDRPSYLRAIMINVSLLRQHDLRYYEPEQTPHLFRDKKHIKMSIYLDVLKALKQPDNNSSDSLCIADLTVMPGSALVRRDFSEQVRTPLSHTHTLT